MIKTLVLSQCTGDKIIKSSDALSYEDFNNEETLKEKSKRMEKVKAIDMYTGRQHIYVVNGVNALRKQYGNNVVDLYILSAGYGIINENDLVVSYNVTFNEMKSPISKLYSWSNKLNVKKDFTKLISNYDLVFIMLGAEYIEALQLPVDIPDNTKLIFLTSGKYLEKVKYHKNVFVFPAGKNEAIGRMGTISLKGYLFDIVAKELVNSKEKDPFAMIYHEPNTLMKIMY